MLPLAHMGVTVGVVQTAEKMFGTSKIDYRLLLTASILPDIIDKPLGYILSAGHALGTRLVGHSLFFLLLILCIGYMGRHRHGKMYSTLFIGSAMHDVLDRMWYYPRTFFGPIAGNNVVNGFETWEVPIKIGFLNITELYALEILGGIILLYLFMSLARQNKIMQFIKSGKLTYSDASCPKYTSKKNNQ